MRPMVTRSPGVTLAPSIVWPCLVLAAAGASPEVALSPSPDTKTVEEALGEDTPSFEAERPPGQADEEPAQSVVPMSRICFYRNGSPVGLAIKFALTADQAVLGTLAIKRYRCADLPAGTHEIGVGAYRGPLMKAIEISNMVAEQRSLAARMLPDELSGADVLDSTTSVSLTEGATHWFQVVPKMWGSALAESDQESVIKAKAQPAQGQEPLWGDERPDNDGGPR